MREISQDLMDRLLSTDHQNELSNWPSIADGVQYVRLPVCDVISKVSLYMQSLTPAETSEFKKTFNLTEVDNALQVFGRVLKHAYELRGERQYRQPEKKGFHVYQISPFGKS
jgi:hypothetical protein